MLLVWEEDSIRSQMDGLARKKTDGIARNKTDGVARKKTDGIARNKTDGIARSKTKPRKLNVNTINSIYHCKFFIFRASFVSFLTLASSALPLLDDPCRFLRVNARRTTTNISRCICIEGVWFIKWIFSLMGTN